MKGLAYQFAFLIIGMSVVTMLYILLAEGMSPVFDFGNSTLNTSDTYARTLFTYTDAIWTFLPVGFLFLCVFYVIMESQKRSFE